MMGTLIVKGLKVSQSYPISFHRKSASGGILAKFPAKFTGKHLFQSLFLNKVAGLTLRRLLLSFYTKGFLFLKTRDLLMFSEFFDEIFYFVTRDELVKIH